MADRKRPWWLAWTNPQMAWFYAIGFTAYTVLFTILWLPGKNWFIACVYVVGIVGTMYSWWAVWYLANRRHRP